MRQYMNVGVSIWVHTTWDCCKKESFWVFWDQNKLRSGAGKWTGHFGWGGIGFQMENLAQGLSEAIQKALGEARLAGCP